MIHIEKAIHEYWSQTEKAPIAAWDHPFPKYEFSPLWRRYLRWYQKHESEKNVLLLPDLPNPLPILQNQPVNVAPAPTNRLAQK